jgi:peptidoglycan/xylan/chitin deacetylase (PgdA/CDA1 family)
VTVRAVSDAGPKESRLNPVWRKAVKAAALPLGAFGGRRTGDVLVLLYHRVGGGDGEIEVSPGSFERQLSHLAEQDRVLTLDQALDGEREGGVVVTFDDGYRDFHDRVLPLLARYRVPVVLYLATRLVSGAAGHASGRAALTWSQLREAVSSGLVTMGSHTHGHVDLSKASEAQADAEMRRSKELIEERLGVACRHFSYPWGVGSPGADRAARRLFESAALDAWRTNRRDRIDRYRLGRTPILRSDDWLFFRSKVAGVLDGEGLVYRVLRRGPWRQR